MACPEPIRLRCMRRNSGEFGITPEELAAILAPFLPGGSGTVKQIVTANTGEVVTSTTAFPQDDTIPQITEGAEVLSLNITPVSATNRLLISSIAFFSANQSFGSGYGIFWSKSNDALAAARLFPNSTSSYVDSMECVADVLTGDTNLVTISTRIGPSTAAGGNTVFVNGNTLGGRNFGGVATTFLSVQEYEP